MTYLFESMAPEKLSPAKNSIDTLATNPPKFKRKVNESDDDLRKMIKLSIYLRPMKKQLRAQFLNGDMAQQFNDLQDEDFYNGESM